MNDEYELNDVELSSQCPFFCDNPKCRAEAERRRRRN